MGFAGVGLIILGALLGLAGSILLIVAAFRTHVGWGLAVLFVPGIASLLFLVLHWREARTAFLVSLASLPFFLGGAAFAVRGAVGEGLLTDADPRVTVTFLENRSGTPPAKDAAPIAARGPSRVTPPTVPRACGAAPSRRRATGSATRASAYAPGA